MTVNVIHGWSVEPGSPFQAPECGTVHLVGVLDSHKGTPNKKVKTSAIVGINGRVVTTQSGSVYKLGAIEPDYRRYLAKIRPDWDWRNPIIFI